MSNINNNVLELIGNTPMVYLKKYCEKHNTKGKIIAKIESFNPSGSVKDRASFEMIKQALADGIIKENATIIEPTSGNTGIGLSMVCAYLGYKLILTMPSTMSIERIKLCKQYGTEVVLTEGKLGMKGAVDKALELHSQIENSFIPQQFENDSNVNAHKISTALEILRDTDNNIDYFVAGVGTGGTITGCGQIIKESVPNCKIVAVEPKGSPLLTENRTGSHAIQGIGANFVPKILDVDLLDEVLDISDTDSLDTSRELAKVEGILIGISGGASLYAATQIAQREESAGKNIVVIFPDDGMKYLSTKLFD